jgi:hypothetical protein
MPAFPFYGEREDNSFKKFPYHNGREGMTKVILILHIKRKKIY